MKHGPIKKRATKNGATKNDPTKNDPMKNDVDGPATSAAALDQLHDAALRARYLLRLYVTGMTPRSTAAFAAIKAICEEHLQGRYDLAVIDIYQHPQLAKDEQIVAVPTLVKKLPSPLRRLIGDLSNQERVLLGLDLRRTT